MPKRTTTSPIERLLARIVITPGPMDSPCWVPTYRTNDDGYTHIRVNGRAEACHRFSYEYFVGPIPEGAEIDHLCRVRACCNWKHLESVGHYENVMRIVDSRHRDGRTHCISGHEFNAENAYWYGRHRQCRVCRRQRAAALSAESKALIYARRRARPQSPRAPFTDEQKARYNASRRAKYAAQRVGS